MPRRFISLLSWRRKPKISHAQLETLFAIAEKERKGEFGSRVLEYWQRFTDEEKAQWEGEKRRSDVFDGMIVGLDEAFAIVAKERDEAFRDEAVEYSDTSQKSEDLREKRFSDAESDRAVAFLKDQETREKRADWYAKIRESRFQCGRQEREEMCQKLERDMQEQVELLLRWQEECFASAEQQRDEIVQQIVTKGQFPHNTSRSGNRDVPNNTRSYTPSDNDSNHPSPVYSHVRPPLSRSPSPRTHVPTPRRHLPSFTDLPAQVNDGAPIVLREPPPEPLVWPHRPTSQSTPKNDQFRPHTSSLSGHPSLMPNIEHTSLDDVKPEPRSNGITVDVFESRFRVNQEQRQNEFLQEEEQRYRRFSEAETERNEAEAARNQTFEKREANRNQKFQAMMSMHQDDFEESETSRGWREDWRTQVSQAAEEDRIRSFEQTLLLIQKQYSALDVLEVDVMQSMQRKMEKLDKRHRSLFKRAKQQRAVAFSLAQTRRELELSVPTWKREDDEGVIADRRRRRRSGFLGYTFKRHFRSRSRSESLERRARWRSPRSRHASMDSRWTPRRLSPATGLHPRALFQETNLREPLPVPGDDKRKALSSDSAPHPRRRQLFDKSQAERDEIFEDGIQERRRIFNVNETQRESLFQQSQRKRMETSIQLEHERLMEFVNAQTTRRATFRDAEGQRESGFRDAERLRARHCRTAWANRDAKFYSMQDRLQEQCLESDRQRTFVFEEWVSKLLRDEEERETCDYKTEEREREERFARAVETSAEQRSAEARSNPQEL